MKKKMRWIAAAIMLVTIVAACALCASAVEPTQEGGHWVINAEKIDEILAGDAGEATVGWEVPFLKVSPTLDGKIAKGEYQAFEMYEDYLSWMAIIGNATQGNTKEEFMEFYEMTKEDFFDAYWGWDGRYLYLAFEVRCVNGFNCKPEEMGGNVYLYAYNMMQVGIAPTDATGKDPRYVELGFGVHSETGEPLTQAWMGPYKPVAGEDFMGTYDKENQTVIYEARIHLQTALGLEDRMVENGDEINFAWLLSVNGETSSVNDYWQVGFCHGIGGQYSNKMTQYFALVTFAGKDVTLDPEELVGASEEDKLYELVEFVDMSDEKVVKSFTGEGASVEYVTEGDESFMRITNISEMPYVWSKSYPRSLQSADCSYITVKYRLPEGTETELGILYRNAYFPEYDLEFIYTEDVGGDGDWHTVTFYMFGEERWQNWIVNIGLAPYAYEDSHAKTIDIAFIKFYLQDPYDLYADSEYDPDRVKETEAVTEEETCIPEDETEENADETQELIEDTTANTPEETETNAPAETAASTEKTTDAPEDTKPVETAASTDAPGEGGDEETQPEETKSGCGAMVGMGLISLLAVGTAVLCRKKED